MSVLSVSSGLTEDQKLIQGLALSFAQHEMFPHMARWDQQEEFPHQVGPCTFYILSWFLLFTILQELIFIMLKGRIRIRSGYGSGSSLFFTMPEILNNF